MSEDITTNLFFRTLKQQYPRIYSEAEKQGWILLVPHSSTIHGMKFTKQIFETHILQPSPFFRSSYITLNKKYIEIEENSLRLGNGFKERNVVKILFEELFYNKDSQPFRVLCIEFPLEGQGNASMSPEKISPSSEVKLPNKNYQECKLFLSSSPVNEIVLSKVQTKISEFNSGYIIVKGFEKHTISKIEQICSQAVEDLLCANPDYRVFYKRNNEKLQDFQLVVENYILGGLHEKLFGGLSLIFEKEDAFLLKRLENLEDINQTDLGVRKELQCSCDDAIQELKQLDNLVTPVEKLFSLQNISVSITKAIEEKNKSDIPKQNDESTITTDDLIPLIINVIIKAKPKRLKTNLFYMENFIFSNIGHTSLGFTLVTFQAGLEFLKSDQVSQFLKNPEEEKNIPSNSNVDVIISNQTKIVTSISKQAFQNEAISSSQKTKNEKITKSQSSSVADLNIRSSGSTTITNNNNNKDTKKTPIGKPPPTIISLNQENELGDFLSTLKNMNSYVTTKKEIGNSEK